MPALFVWRNRRPARTEKSGLISLHNKTVTDIYSRAQRSALMARVRGRCNTTTEGALAAIPRAEGWSGWLRQQVVPGRTAAGARFRVRPDFVFRARRLVVFVDGCFWHGCPRHGTQPNGNAAFWRAPFASGRKAGGPRKRASFHAPGAGLRCLGSWTTRCPDPGRVP